MQYYSKRFFIVNFTSEDAHHLIDLAKVVQRVVLVKTVHRCFSQEEALKVASVHVLFTQNLPLVGDEVCIEVSNLIKYLMNLFIDDC